MEISKNQRERAQRIDTFVNTIFENGGSEEDILTGMFDYMNDFKVLMDELPNGGVDFLCSQYQGFFRFAKLLERLAEGLQSGKIKV